MPGAKKPKARKTRKSRGRKAIVAVRGNTVLLGYMEGVKRPGISAKALAAAVKKYDVRRDRKAVVADRALIVARDSGIVAILGGPYIWPWPPRH